MSDAQTTDMIRWTFTADPAQRAAIEAYLVDLGLDVYVRGEAQFTALWEEPEGELDAVVEELWALNGAPFEITHEEFQRQNLSVYHSDGDAAEAA